MSLGHERPEHANSRTSGEHAHEAEEGAASVAAAEALEDWIGELAAALAIDPTGIDPNEFEWCGTTEQEDPLG